MSKKTTAISETKPDSKPVLPAVPVLSTEEKLHIRNIQVRALAMEPQYKAVMQELNAAYQAVMAKNPDFNFDADQLAFVPKQ